MNRAPDISTIFTEQTRKDNRVPAEDAGACPVISIWNHSVHYTGKKDSTKLNLSSRIKLV